MLKLNSSDRPIYFGNSDETLPDAAGLADGTLMVLMDKSECWSARSGVWVFQMPMEMTTSIPYGGLPDAVSLPTSYGIVRRPIVALASTLPGQPLSGIETLLGKLIETNLLILTEMRVNNILLQGVGTVPVTDDLDQLRAYALENAETITR